MMLTRDSYIVYIALIAMYLVLIIFFFPETRYVFHPELCQFSSLTCFFAGT